MSHVCQVSASILGCCCLFVCFFLGGGGGFFFFFFFFFFVCYVCDQIYTRRPSRSAEALSRCLGCRPGAFKEFCVCSGVSAYVRMYMSVCLPACLCVSARVRDRERGRERDRQTPREKVGGGGGGAGTERERIRW